MRDVILTAIVGALLVLILRNPAIGAYTWAWLSLMNPHRFTFGFASTMPFALATALVTGLAFALTRRRRALPMTGIVWLLLIQMFWMSVTSLFAIATQDAVLDRWIFVMKIQVMLLLTFMVVLDAKQIRTLVWVVTMSVAYYGIKGGVFTITTGGSGRVWGPAGSMLEGNNELAVALVMLMPMLYFLWQTEPKPWLRKALVASLALVALSILGSQSRGALLALLAMGLLLGLKSKRPALTSILILILVPLAIAFMPDSWTSRMDTMRTYQQDDSAMSRIWTWTTLWNAAVDRPLVGAGFRADTQAVFKAYAPVEGVYAIFAGRVLVAHSIYFQVLGEHGFVGLFLFLAIGFVTWQSAARIAKRTTNDPEFGSWMPLLMRMVQVGLIGFSAGGAFLSLAYSDLPYYVIGFVVLCDALVRERDKAAANAPMAGAVVHPKPRRDPPRQIAT